MLLAGKDGVERGLAARAVIQSGQTFKVEAVVHNGSPRSRARGCP